MLLQVNITQQKEYIIKSEWLIKTEIFVTYGSGIQATRATQGKRLLKMVIV